jgi:transposase
MVDYVPEVAVKALFPLVPETAYHPSALLKLYVYGYLNRVQSA